MIWYVNLSNIIGNVVYTLLSDEITFFLSRIHFSGTTTATTSKKKICRTQFIDHYSINPYNHFIRHELFLGKSLPLSNRWHILINFIGFIFILKLMILGFICCFRRFKVLDHGRNIIGPPLVVLCSLILFLVLFLLLFFCLLFFHLMASTIS